MADRVSIAGEPRNVIGKKVKQLRREGIVPAVVYGQTDPVHVQFPRRELRRVLRDVGRTALIDLNIEGDKVYTVLARDIQQHLTRGDVLHVDFYEVNMLVSVTVEAGLVTIGESQLVVDAVGRVVIVPNVIEISCKPDNLVDELEVDISLIVKPDDAIFAHQLVLPEGVELAGDPEQLIARFAYMIVEEEEEEEELDELDLDEDALEDLEPLDVEE